MTAKVYGLIRKTLRGYGLTSPEVSLDAEA